MDRKDLDRPEYGSYEEVHEMLIRAMQDACMKDTSREYEPPQIDMSFLYEDEKTKKTMAYRVIRIVAILFLAFGMLLGINAVLLTSDSNDVYGEKGLLHRIHEGVRGIFTDEDPSQYVEVDETGEVCLIENMENINIALNFWGELCVPNYIPENYKLNYLEVKHDYSGVYSAIYLFTYQEKELYISIIDHDERIEKYLSKEILYTIKAEDRIISFYEDERYISNVADVYFNELLIHIYGDLDENEIIDVAKEIK